MVTTMPVTTRFVIVLRHSPIMANNAPGRHYRSGLSLMEVMRRFPDDRTAHDWFASIRWEDGPRCPRCGTANVLIGTAHRSMPYVAVPAAATSLSRPERSWSHRTSAARPGPLPSTR